MRRHSSFLLASALLLALAPPANAAPVSVVAELRLDISGLQTPVVLAGGGTIDISGGIYTIPAGIIMQTTPMTVPVTAFTSVAALQLVGIQNLAASLAVGGATSQAPSEVCVVPGLGEACVVGGGIGGPMALSGTMNISIIPSLVVFPLDLNNLQIGQGGSGAASFSYDAGIWTTRTALVNLTVSTVSAQGSATTGGGITLVSANYVLACGNLLPIMTTLTLTPTVPEPSTLALLAAGVAGLILVRRRR